MSTDIKRSTSVKISKADSSHQRSTFTITLALAMGVSSNVRRIHSPSVCTKHMVPVIDEARLSTRIKSVRMLDSM